VSSTTIANDVLPSIVTISASRGQTGGSGSGEIIRADGYILTNDHVISVAANGGSVEVLLSDGRRPTPASSAVIRRRISRC